MLYKYLLLLSILPFLLNAKPSPEDTLKAINKAPVKKTEKTLNKSVDISPTSQPNLPKKPAESEIVGVYQLFEGKKENVYIKGEIPIQQMGAIYDVFRKHTPNLQIDEKNLPSFVYLVGAVKIELIENGWAIASIISEFKGKTHNFSIYKRIMKGDIVRLRPTPPKPKKDDKSKKRKKKSKKRRKKRA